MHNNALLSAGRAQREELKEAKGFPGHTALAVSDAVRANKRGGGLSGKQRKIDKSEAPPPTTWPRGSAFSRARTLAPALLCEGGGAAGLLPQRRPWAVHSGAGAAGQRNSWTLSERPAARFRFK